MFLWRSQKRSVPVSSKTNKSKIKKSKSSDLLFFIPTLKAQIHSNITIWHKLFRKDNLSPLIIPIGYSACDRNKRPINFKDIFLCSSDHWQIQAFFCRKFVWAP